MGHSDRLPIDLWSSAVLAWVFCRGTLSETDHRSAEARLTIYSFPAMALAHMVDKKRNMVGTEKRSGGKKSLAARLIVLTPLRLRLASVSGDRRVTAFAPFKKMEPPAIFDGIVRGP